MERRESELTKDFLDIVHSENSRKDSRHPLFFTYKGRSMNPTLWQGDLLEVIPYDGIKIKEGDIIIFNNPQGEGFIVHRIVSMSSHGIYTKGDNNNHRDQWNLGSSAIIGKVIAATYSIKRRNLRGGLLGLLLAPWSHSMHKIFCRGFAFMPTISELAASQDILCCLGTQFIKPKIVIFKTNGKNSIMLLAGKRIIGRYNYGMNQWNFCNIYRLFIDEDVLPDISSFDQ